MPNYVSRLLTVYTYMYRHTHTHSVSIRAGFVMLFCLVFPQMKASVEKLYLVALSRFGWERNISIHVGPRCLAILGQPKMARIDY